MKYRRPANCNSFQGYSACILSLQSSNWLKIEERINCQILSLTYKSLTPPNLHICMIFRRSILSSDVVTLARPTVYSSLKVNNRSFRHASPRLWNELLKALRQPV